MKTKIIIAHNAKGSVEFQVIDGGAGAEKRFVAGYPCRSQGRIEVKLASLG
ncbi:MAG: hypothetical protein K9G38_05745 [Bacteroidales bacterium]|nr:hypothetical protein [Bacteroidales bacterium]